MKRPITFREVANAKPDPRGRRREIGDGATGLYLVVQPSGAKSWAFRYRFRGKPRKLSLGKWPAVGLPDAREKAGAAIRDLDRGLDPAADRAAQRRRRPGTVRELGERFVELYAKPRLRTWRDRARSLELHVYPAIGDLDVDQVRRSDVIDLLDRMQAGGSKPRANHVHAAVRKLFAWAVERDLIETSPCAGIKRPAPLTTRERILSDDEVVAFLRACDALDEPAAKMRRPAHRRRHAEPIPARYGTLFKLLLLTAARRDEIGAGRWAEVDAAEALLRLPGERTKNARAHDLPLAPQALALIDALPSRGRALFLFPSRDDHERPAAGYAGAKRRLDALMLAELDRLAEAREEAARVAHAPWRLHDLRRTAASGMARLGIGIHVTERLLNHASGSTVGGLVEVYQRHDFAAEKRAAAAAWADYLDRLAAPPAGNVVALRGRAS